MTADEYFKQTAETAQPQELIDGEIVAFASPSTRHQSMVGGLYAELRRARILDYRAAETACVCVFLCGKQRPEVYDFHTPVPVRIWEGKLSIIAAELDT